MASANNDRPPKDVISNVLTLLAYPFVGHWAHLKEVSEIDELQQKNDATAVDLDRRLAALHGTASGGLAPSTMASASTNNSDASRPSRPGIISSVLTLMAYPFFGHQEHLKVMARIDELRQKNDATATVLERELAELHGTTSGGVAAGKEPSKPASSFLLLGAKAPDKAPDAASAPGKLF
jgi:hypothetical protein